MLKRLREHVAASGLRSAVIGPLITNQELSYLEAKTIGLALDMILEFENEKTRGIRMPHEMKPTTGSIVQYHLSMDEDRGDAWYPAIVVRVLESGELNLRVFFDAPSGYLDEYRQLVTDEMTVMGQWRWPPRE